MSIRAVQAAGIRLLWDRPDLFFDTHESSAHSSATRSRRVSLPACPDQVGCRWEEWAARDDWLRADILPRVVALFRADPRSGRLDAVGLHHPHLVVADPTELLSP